jgi:hypothetical protein
MSTCRDLSLYPAFISRFLVVWMVYCPKCGKELPADAVFCDRCGQKMSEPVVPTERWESRFERRMERRFERWENHGPDYLDGVGFGVFLIAVAWVYLQYPWVWEEFTAWFSGWINGPTMLPLILAEPIVLFFMVMGGWSLIEGTLRVVSGRVMKGLSNVIGSIGSLAIAYMMRLYGQGEINGSAILPYFIMIIGATIVLSAVVGTIAWSTSPRRD